MFEPLRPPNNDEGTVPLPIPTDSIQDNTLHAPEQGTPSSGSSPEKIVYKRLRPSGRKVDTSIKPSVRGEINKLTRIFTGWTSPDTSISDRNKIELTPTQLEAVLWARERHVTPVQIADVLGISVYRVHKIVHHAKTIRKRQLAESKKLSSLGGYSGSTPEGHIEEESLVAHIQKSLVITDTSPRT
jgi:DNA-binding CsgD family transcriptional regulator